MCVVCKKHKVKNGSICYECRELEKKASKQLSKERSGHKPIIEMNTENIEEKNTENNVPNENFGISVSTKVQNKIVSTMKDGPSRRVEDSFRLKPR